MPSRGSGSGTASASTSGTTAEDVVEPASSRWRFEGRNVDSSYSWPSSSYWSDSSTDESGDSGGEESRTIVGDLDAQARLLIDEAESDCEGLNDIDDI